MKTFNAWLNRKFLAVGKKVAAGIVIMVMLIVIIKLVVSQPVMYEKYSFSTSVFDQEGKLLKLTLSMDEKYRLFVPYEEIPQTVKQALLLYEDRSFYSHPGVNPLSLFRAVAGMARGERRQGASTITMQLARMLYQIDSSSFSGKIEQILRALQIEVFYNKEQILEAYFNLAPYGGNIEGLGAAARVYFNKKISQLNLPEVIALTVIPQNPSKRELLTAKGRKNNQKAAQRLQKLWLKKYQHSQNNSFGLPLAIGHYLPNNAPHFVRALKAGKQGNIISTLNLNDQSAAEIIIKNYIIENENLGIHNASALIVDANNMEVLVYIGSADFNNQIIKGQVDGVKALRSPGSALKPFIYALALDQGIIHPMTMLKDIPTRYGHYTPENFDHSFYGMLNATQALVLSRNLPAVDLLMQVGEDRLYNLLKACGVKFSHPAKYYGLAMALGGIEVSMRNMAEMYAMLYNSGKYQPLVMVNPLTDKSKEDQKLNLPSVVSAKSQTSIHKDKPVAAQILSPEAAFLTLEMLTHNPAPDDKHIRFAMARQTLPTAWKTGTSYGYRDAWAVGVVGHYVIVVWVGNFDGKANHAFVGREAAAPLFFRLVRQIAAVKLDSLQRQSIQNSSKFEPHENLNIVKVKVCVDTGDLATPWCHNQTESYFIPGVSKIKVSNIARLIPIDVKTGLRACRHTPPATVLKSYNFWTSEIKRAYREAGISLKQVPSFMENCDTVETIGQGRRPQILLPMDGGVYLIGKKTEQTKKIVLQAALDADAKTIYWFINDRLSATSEAGEAIEVNVPQGALSVKAVDDLGRSSTINIKIKMIE